MNNTFVDSILILSWSSTLHSPSADVSPSKKKNISTHLYWEKHVELRISRSVKFQGGKGLLSKLWISCRPQWKHAKAGSNLKRKYSSLHADCTAAPCQRFAGNKISARVAKKLFFMKFMRPIKGKS